MMDQLRHENPMALLGAGASLAIVLSVQDPDNQNRIQVRIPGLAGIDGQDGAVWARVVAPFTEDGRGGTFLPNVGDEVLIVFLSGDPRSPVVLGGLWKGPSAPPETSASSSIGFDQLAVTGKAGTKIALVEDSAGVTIQFSAAGQPPGSAPPPGGGPTGSVRGLIRIDSSGIAIDAPAAKIQIKAAASVNIVEPQLSVNAAMATFSGIVQCQVLQATTVVAETVTQGAGGTW